MSYHEPSYLAGRDAGYCQLAEDMLRTIYVADAGEHELRVTALRALDALKHRIRYRFDDEQPAAPTPA